MEQQQKERQKVRSIYQDSYVDGNRNMAVVLGDRELSKALKQFDRERAIVDQNKGVVNCDMFKRQALHFASKKQHESAKKYFALGNTDHLDPSSPTTSPHDVS